MATPRGLARVGAALLAAVLCALAGAVICRLGGNLAGTSLNVLAHVLSKPYQQILAEFKDPVQTRTGFRIDLGWAGDVKYHAGAVRSLKSLTVSMAPNPSHLEFVNPVVAGMARDELERDRKTLFAVIRCVEIIGEAAARISEATRTSTPDIPWSAITGMRNRLVHAYFDVDTDVLWNTVTVELMFAEIVIGMQIDR